MRKLLSILWNSFRMALQELKVNKLRTFLSLFGITIGIFCIIGVLATVHSLESKVQSDVQSLGSNSIYIDKWEYSGGPDYPWWKFVNRPVPKYDEVKMIREKSGLAEYICYFNSVNTNVQAGNSQLNNVSIDGVSEEFNKIQTIDIGYGRYLNESEFLRGNPVCIIGYENADQLFGNAQKAVGQSVMFDKKKFDIIGVIAKQGSSMIGGYDYDHSIIVSYRSFASMYNVNSNNTQPYIMVKGKDNIPSTAMVDELEGIMRQIRKLSPTDEDNFALNDINVFSQQVSGFFGTVNIGGWAIAGLSLIVGAFGVANIMFVTVRERTSQIGLKKAIGAKSGTILTEFLLESAFLCIIGGVIGLFLVWVLATILSGVLPFPIAIAGNIVILAFTICVILGILSGIIPASIAAKMNPVVAIRSK
ncbi:ABC transporter permease [Deminuibacter soli]|uniref:ABC transporter permease n=1 Tax=Deminuibacter soli TaxID=2291815 RepID=A0A3E1NKU1_9BACT|nr:ABC transporter permease [Deminuibacter soli]RFM28559.1 ABC transporter permease [Deminuibacter soli]